MPARLLLLAPRVCCLCPAVPDLGLLAVLLLLLLCVCHVQVNGAISCSTVSACRPAGSL